MSRPICRPASLVILILGMLHVLLIAGCGSTAPAPAGNPVPSITTLSPSSLPVGSPAQSLNINGANFLASSTVTYNGAAHAATFISSSELTINLSVGDLNTAGSYPVVISNPAPGGGNSTAVNLVVSSPTISSLAPPSAVQGSTAQTLTITGTNFLSTSTVTYNGIAHAATFASSTQLTIMLSAGDQATAGSYAVVVTNPSAAGGSSNQVNFAVTLPPPAIASLAPPSTLAGSAAQTLTINGTNFVTGATVTYSGTAHSATFVSSTQLTIALSAADQATAGNNFVVVTNPDTQSSNIVDFTVNNPVPAITTLAPASTFPCDAVPTLTINGSNFFSTSTVKFGGNAKTATFVSSTQLTIPLTVSDIATPGNINVVITNPGPGGGSSTAVAFVVNAPAGPTLSGIGSLGASLKVYSVNPDGTTGAILCTSTTDATTGAFSVTLDAATVGPVRLITTGGQVTYLGVAGGVVSNTNYPETSPDSALFDSVPAGTTNGIAIGMLSTFVDSLTQGNLTLLKQPTVIAAHASATALIDGLYGFTAGATVELIGTSGGDGLKRELAEQGVLTEGLLLSPNSPGDLRGALATDISDASWDGMASGMPVAFGTGNLPATAGTTDFLSATVSWVKGPGVVVLGATAPPTPSIVQGVTACSCTPFGVGLSPGNTASIASLAFSGHQYLFIAAGASGVVSVDISDPTNPAPAVKAWPGVTTATFGGTKVSGVAAIAGNADHPQIFAFTGTDQQVAVLDARTLVNGNPATDNPAEFQGSLVFKSNTTIQLSGGTWWITGAVWDGCQEGCRVVLATVDGYTFFDPAKDALDESKIFPVDGVNRGVTGNMGPDLSTGINVANPLGVDSILLAGNPGGVQLVDFSANASFYISQATLTSNSYFPNFPANYLPGSADDGDGNAIDPVYQVGLLTPEGISTTVVGLLNLHGITETLGATADQNTFAPAGAKQVTLASTSFSVEGSAIEPTTHLALLMGPSSVITVGKIQDPATPNWSGLSDWSFYDLSNSPAFPNLSLPTLDIHGVTTVASLGIVKPSTLNIAYGFWLDGSAKVSLQFDLNAFLSLARQGINGDAAHQPAGDPTTATDAATGGAVIVKITW